MRAGDAVRKAAARFGLSDTPRLDAELLMAETLGTSREEMLLRHMDDPAPPGFAALAARRAGGEPVAYILGRRGFWTIELEVGPGALVPRPDSETLIETAVDRFGAAGPERILDLGTGPGTLLLAALAEWPRATGLGIDISAVALGYARRNADSLGLAGRARFARMGWEELGEEKYDLVLCNPPYVARGDALPPTVSAYEPPEALYAGADGLRGYRRLAPLIGGWLAPGGLACFELGAGQYPAAREIFAALGWKCSGRRDLAGRRRCLVIEN
ncbi:MAG: peptide chain release factor N(5)-glutamine methyltransferase [Sphingomonadaceae bacterium]